MRHISQHTAYTAQLTPRSLHRAAYTAQLTQHSSHRTAKIKKHNPSAIHVYC